MQSEDSVKYNKLTDVERYVIEQKGTERPFFRRVYRLFCSRNISLPQMQCSVVPF
jgi:peptide methionine sulfoxide reductase MsrB